MGIVGGEDVLWVRSKRSASWQYAGERFLAAEMEKISFSEKVYSLCCKIPKGKVTTYQEIALVLNTKGYQAIGQALRCNPYAPHVPCHRVVKSDGSVGGFKGKRKGKEIQEKIRLLEKEGVEIVDGKVDLKIFKFSF